MADAVAAVDASEAAPVRVTLEQLGVSPSHDASSHLEFDLGNLSAFDPTPLNPEDFTPLNRNATCLQVASTMTQALVSQLFSLPSEAVQGGRLAQLPPCSTALPREKPIPKPRPLTKWQQFAQEKGIRKRKRSKLVWDDEAQEWRRRHGYKRANDDADVPVIEARASDQLGEDPFTLMRQEKRERIKVQQKQQAANVKQAVKSGGTASMPATLRLAASLPSKGKGKPTKRKELRDEIKTMSWLSGVSTASMGKFDKKLPGEKEGERKLPGKRRKFAAVTDATADRALMSKTADKLLRQKADDVLDINKAIGKFEAAARQERHTAKQAGEGRGSSKKGDRKGSRQNQGEGKGGKPGKRGGPKKGGRVGAPPSGGKLKARGGVGKKAGGKRGK